MKNKKLIIILSSFIVLLLLGILAFFLFYESDALKFKKEYESLNNTVNEKNGLKYQNLNIDKDNPIKYVTVKEAVELLDRDDAIIYVGANWCPWCRNAVSVLLDALKNKGVKTLYYLNLDNDKSQFKIVDKKLVKTKDGTDDYYKLLDKLKDRLRDYVLSDEDGTSYDTNEKRIYMPYVFGVKNKQVIKDYKTITLNENQTAYDPLTKDQYDTLLKEYESIADAVYGKNTCNIGEECN